MSEKYSIGYSDIIKGFPSTITPPPELEKLVAWANENEHKMGGHFELFADTENKCLEYWSQSTYLNNNFAQFGVGPSGAPTGIWRNDDGVQKIVYLFDEERWGDVIAESFLDWMRILAIGYEDVNESCNLDIKTYNKQCEREDLMQGHNPAFKAWVEKEFNTNVPATGDEVFIKERDSFNVWLNVSIRKYAVENIAKHPLFLEIGKDIRESWIYSGLFYSEPLLKEENYFITQGNHCGVKAICNEDYTIKHLILGGNKPGLFSYRHENPGAFESADTRAMVVATIGEPTSKGITDECEMCAYKFNTANGERNLQILWNPEKEKDNIWEMKMG